MELQRILPGISTEQLRSRLNRMVADGLLTRQRYREVPPRVDYELTDRARDLMPVLGALARWGYDWAWSPPRARESVDVTAIFRLAEGLVAPGAPAGTAELVVTGDGAEVACYTIVRGESQVRVFQRPAPEDADVRISGDVEAWVNALSPHGEREGLIIVGCPRLAVQLLDGLASRPAMAPAAAAIA